MSINSRRTKRTLIIAGLLVVGLVFLVAKANRASTTDGPLKGKTAIVYRSATCGCCANYIAYLRRLGVKVEEKTTDDMTAIKTQFGVPEDLLSCHTTRIDNYTVEGHVPVEAIGKLLSEKSALAGIALPKMPSGSPGMPGAKYGAFDISGFTSAESFSPYVSI